MCWLGLLYSDGSELGFEFDQSLQRFQEVLESWCWQHDRITPSTHVLGDLKKTPTLIFFQVEEEDFALDSYLFGSNRFRTHAFPRIGVHHI